MKRDLESTIVNFISPREYWEAMKANCNRLPWEVRYQAKATKSFEDIVAALENLEEATWSIPTPSFIRSNFGLYGPGVVLALNYQDLIVASLYFVGPTVFQRKSHIWTLIVHPEFRGQRFAQQMLATASAAVNGIAEHFTVQTTTKSKAIPLYLRMGENRITWVQAHDTGTWEKPKIGLEIPVPETPFCVFSKRKRSIINTDNFTVAPNDHFWQQLGRNRNLWGRYEIIDCNYGPEGKLLYLKDHKRGVHDLENLAGNLDSLKTID